ncbi:MAG: hypothetical protein EXR72_15065 [Myxococcales bacterium]|nr:hypothetical protein [Myxococcales bacterium]
MGSLLCTLILGLRPVLSGPEATHGAGRFRVHYTLAGADALAHGPVDVAPKNGVPDDVDAVAGGLAQVIAVWVDGVGMRPPLDDGGDGGDRRVDVYLRRLAGARGITHPDPIGAGAAASAWIELDPRSALISPIRLAAAAGHEAHHAVQYAYSPSLPRWIHEATSTYVELAGFGDPALQKETDAHFAALLDHPETPLDRVDGVHEYDAMVFVKFLRDQARSDVRVRELWEQMGIRKDPIAAIEAVEDRTIAEVLAEFGRWNLHACGADDGAHYDPARAACGSSERPAVRGVGAVPSRITVPLDRLAVAWLSIPIEGCAVEATFAGVTDVAWAGGGSPSPLRSSDTIRLGGPGPMRLVLATGRGTAPDLAVALALAEGGCSDGGLRGMPGSGCGCALAGRPARRSLVAALLLGLVATLVAIRGGGGGGRSPGAGRRAGRATGRSFVRPRGSRSPTRGR